MTEENDSKGLRDKWLKLIEQEEKAHRKWRERADEVLKRHEEERDDDNARFNILWPNTEVVHGAVYSNTANPDVRRRYLDKDQLSREVAEVLERAISFSVDNQDFDSFIDSAVDDYLLSGLGVVRERYQPYFDKGEPEPIPVEPVIEDDELCFYHEGKKLKDNEIIEGADGHYIEGEAPDVLVYEECITEPVYWRYFRWDHSAKSWNGVKWCAIDHLLTKEELEEQFPGKDVELTHKTDGTKGDEGENDRALVCEVFDKEERKIIVVSNGYKAGVLDEIDDPLGLKDFYPFPKPMFATTHKNKLIPIPDFVFYQDQADELDRVTDRINLLIEELKYRGVYDGSFKNMPDIAKLDDGEFQPIQDFQKITQGQSDLKALIAHLPLDEIYRVVSGLYRQRNEIKQTIYEITGIADIMRGSSNASETLGAQQLKANFGNMRISRRQKVVANFIRDLFRIKSEIFANHFQQETLSLMTGKEVTPEMMEIMRNNVLLAYKIDVESDSTVAVDAQMDQKNRNEFIGALTGLLEKLAPAVQAGYVPADVAKEIVLFGVRGYKAGRSLEDAIERIGQDQGGMAPVPGNPAMGGLPPQG